MGHDDVRKMQRRQMTVDPFEGPFNFCPKCGTEFTGNGRCMGCNVKELDVYLYYKRWYSLFDVEKFRREPV